MPRGYKRGRKRFRRGRYPRRYKKKKKFNPRKLTLTDRIYLAQNGLRNFHSEANWQIGISECKTTYSAVNTFGTPTQFASFFASEGVDGDPILGDPNNWSTGNKNWKLRYRLTTKWEIRNVELHPIYCEFYFMYPKDDLYVDATSTTAADVTNTMARKINYDMANYVQSRFKTDEVANYDFSNLNYMRTYVDHTNPLFGEHVQENFKIHKSKKGWLMPGQMMMLQHKTPGFKTLTSEEYKETLRYDDDDVLTTIAKYAYKEHSGVLYVKTHMAIGHGVTTHSQIGRLSGQLGGQVTHHATFAFIPDSHMESRRGQAVSSKLTSFTGGGTGPTQDTDQADE